MKKAFTLVEILIILSLAFVIITFGSIGVVTVRNNLTLNTVYADLATFVKNVRSNARNSLLIELRDGSTTLPDYYAVSIFEDSSTGNITYNQLAFLEDEILVDRAILVDNTAQLVPQTDELNGITINVTCDDGSIIDLNQDMFIFAFSRLNQDIILLDQASTNTDYSINNGNIICTIIVDHEDLVGSERELSIDIRQNRVFSNDGTGQEGVVSTPVNTDNI